MSAILRLGLRSKAATFMGLLAVMLLLAAVATSWIFIDLTREQQLDVLARTCHGVL